METKLTKKYGLVTAIAMVVGTVIGSGVFFKAGKVLTNNNGSMAMSLLTVAAVGAIMVICSYVFSMLAQRYEKVNGLVDYAEATCGKNYATIARAELDWELVSPYVGTSAILEGPFFIQNDGRIFLIYSANGCWSNYYALGVLEYIGGAFNSPDSWKKHPEPLLTFGNGVYGPGHASFFYSPDKTELWCVYHGMAKSNENSPPAYRYCHLQKVEFDNTGYPVMGNPVGTTTPILPPSGEEK